MSFFHGADAYDRFMGRYSTPLAPQMADLAGVAAGQQVLDVGCGPGALTSELVARVGAPNVSAVDPSESFVTAAAERFPVVDVRQARAEHLPFGDGEFDAALAQLVVHFMDDPRVGVREMRRVTRPGGVVAATVWDFTSGGPLTPFWQAVRQLDPDNPGEVARMGSRPGQLAALFVECGLTTVEEHVLSVEVQHTTFEEWWEPYTLGIGPAGAYVAGLDDEARDRLRDTCRSLLPPAPFTIVGRAWAARGLA